MLAFGLSAFAATLLLIVKDAPAQSISPSVDNLLSQALETEKRQDYAAAEALSG